MALLYRVPAVAFSSTPDGSYRFFSSCVHYLMRRPCRALCPTCGTRECHRARQVPDAPSCRCATATSAERRGYPRPRSLWSWFLLIGIVLAGLGFGVISLRQRQECRLLAIAAIEAGGGTTTTKWIGPLWLSEFASDPQRSRTPVWHGDSFNVPSWFRNSVSGYFVDPIIDRQMSIEEIVIGSGNDMELELYFLGNAKRIISRQRTLSRSEIKTIARYPDLEALDLSDSQLDDRGLQLISQSTSIREIKLVRTAVTNASVRSLQSMTALETIDLSFTAVNDSGILELQELSGLRSLVVNGCDVSNETLETVRRTTPRISIRRNDTHSY
jgi:hypothetical protein